MFIAPKSPLEYNLTNVIFLIDVMQYRHTESDDCDQTSSSDNQGQITDSVFISVHVPHGARYGRRLRPESAETE